MLLRNSEYKIKDIALADAGNVILEDVYRHMPVVSIIAHRFDNQKPFQNLKILVCSHMTKETAIACIALQKGGADVMVMASETISTDDRVAAALVKNYGIRTYAQCGASAADLNAYREAAYAFESDLLLDDGAEILPLFYEHHPERTEKLIASLEQTTSGVFKVQRMDELGKLNHPVLCVNSNPIKHLFDNYYGVGQSTVLALLLCTKKLLAGIHIVIVGYGHVGAGIASYLRGIHASVIVCEKDPTKALQAYMDGFQVMNLEEAVKYGEVFITATGSADVIPEEIILKMRTGAILTNCGSGKNEIAVEALEKHAVKKESVSAYITRFILDNGKSVDLLMNGMVVNFVVSGCPPEIMDITFSVVLLGMEYAVKNKGKLPHHAQALPKKFDETIALLKLHEYGIRLNTPTEKQKQYDNSWRKY